MKRRTLLALAAASAAAAPDRTLQQHAAARGLLYGSAVSSRLLATEPAYAALVAQQCGIIVPDIEAKWAATEPWEGRFDFARLDQVMAFARQHGMAVRLHNLAWGVYNPPWLAGALAQGRAAQVLQAHVAAVVGRYAGQVLAWDVANEPSDPRWNQADDLVDIGWKKALGAGYLDEAFAAAHAADPHAILFINDDLLEYADAASQAKRDGYLRLLPRLLRRGVRLGGFGLEAHLRPERPFAAGPYRAFLRELAGMGLVVHVTELDISDRTLPAEVAPRDAALAALCKAYLDTALDEPAVHAVLTWGLTTRNTWLATATEVSRTDGLPPRGLPYDAHFDRTPLWGAIASALDHAPVRSGALPHPVGALRPQTPTPF